MPKNLGQYNNDLSVPRKKDIDDLANVVDGKYSASNPPPYPVTSVNNKTGDVTLTASDVGAAPDGYGLGSTATSITDLNDAIKDGWYSCVGAANLPPNVESVQYGVVLVMAHASDRIMQMYEQCVTGGTHTIAFRWKDGNGWSDWEFLNPPLAVGVEYRTVERYLGLPVYTKIISYTTASPVANTDITVPHGITGLNQFVRFAGRGGQYTIPYFSSSGSYTALRAVNSTNLLFANYGNTGWGTTTWYLTLHYTKTA